MLLLAATVCFSRSWPSKKKLTLEDFAVLRVIGKGSFGKVFLVERKDKAEGSTGAVYAMKVRMQETRHEGNIQ